MASFGIEPSAAHQSASDLQGLTQKLLQALEDLRTAAAQYQANNAGNAIENYGQVQQELNTAIQDLGEALGKSGNTLTDIIDNYVQGDLTGAGFFSR